MNFVRNHVILRAVVTKFRKYDSSIPTNGGANIRFCPIAAIADVYQSTVSSASWKASCVTGLIANFKAVSTKRDAICS